MEAVGAIASIAGILSLIGQSMSGINNLRGFFQSCASESQSVERFLKRLNDLIQTLENTSDLMTKLGSAPSKIVSESILSSLQIQIDDCNKDVYTWLSIARTCLPTSNTGTKAAFKRFLIALQKPKITDIYTEISAHKNNIITKLSVIGRCFDIDQSATLETICRRLKTWEDLEQSINFTNWKKQEKIISSYETLSQPDSSSSLASIAESLARIENKIGDPISPRSPYSSRRGSDGSLNSASITGRRRWSSDLSQYSTFTAPRSHEIKLTSLPEELRQSLVGLQREERRKSSDLYQDQALNFHSSSREVGQHNAQNDCPGTRYSQSTQTLSESFIQEATKYIDLILRAEAIIFKIKLFKTTPFTLFSFSEHAVNSEIKTLERQLRIISSEANALRLSSWRKGFNTYDLDSHIAQCQMARTPLGSAEYAVPEEEKDPGAVKVKTSENSKLRLKASAMNATQYDRVNMWLLNNLEASNKEKKLHRSFLPNAASYDEEQWTRMVLKYWLLDEAATVPVSKSFSSNGAVDSDGRCHSERVLLENAASSELAELENIDSTGTVPNDLMSNA